MRWRLATGDWTLVGERAARAAGTLLAAGGWRLVVAGEREIATGASDRPVGDAAGWCFTVLEQAKEEVRS